MNAIHFIAVIIIFVNSYGLFAQIPSELRYEDRIRIAEAINIADLYADSVWRGWSEVPMVILLVTDSTEFLVNHNMPSEDFQLMKYDSLLNTNVYYRPRVFATHLLATFPAVNGVSTIVVGTPENTGKSTSRWIITLLHEYFHQLQDFQPDYFSGVEELDLHGGDETGMWMLNYLFPYENEEINILYDKMKKVLVSIFDDERDFTNKIELFLELRKNFKDLLEEKDYKYFSFQGWQEGIARYSEIEVVKLLGRDNYQPSIAVKELEDDINFNVLSEKLYTAERNLLNGLKLNESKRNCFYPFGAFEGMLLDILGKEWKERYLKEMFSLEDYYK